MKIEDINLKRFFAKIQKDISPYLGEGANTEEEQAARGLTALFLATEAGMPIEQANFYVVDEGEDLGIDGLYFNPATQVLYIVQSKFRINQNKSLSQGEMLKFKDGISKVLKAKVEGANPKFRAAFDNVEHALSDISTRIKLCIVSTSKRELELNVSSVLDDFCKELNEIDSTFSHHYYKFNSLYQKAKTFTSEVNTNIEIPLYSYGRVAEPHLAFYGSVEGADVAGWVKEYGSKIFEQNVRFTLQNTDVNEGIFDTIRENPQNFWYYNNGITAIAGDVKTVPGEGNPKIVKASSLSIVNGAQTAGMLARAVEEGIDVSKVKIQFRVISLEGAPAALDEEITRANNTQNELNALDFVSLDPRQDLLRNELAGLGYEYVFKRGAETDTSKTIIEVKDAAIALACASGDIGLSVQAKRYVSALWNNIKTEPYTKIFRDGLDGSELVSSWSAYKECEAATKELKMDANKETASILSHGDRFIAHCVFALARDKGIDLEQEGNAKKQAKLVAKNLVKNFDKVESSYPATAFKNQKVQEKLKTIVLAELN